MTSPMQPFEADESWDAVEERVVREAAADADRAYAERLRDTYNSYRKVGFSRRQAWELTRTEHVSRLEHHVERCMTMLHHELETSLEE